MELSDRARVARDFYLSIHSAAPVNGSNALQQIGHLVDECSIERSEESKCGYRAHAPSPWHAWALLFHQSLQLQSGSVGVPPTPVFFRGQGNPAWDLLPSIRRPGVNVDEEKQVGAAFASLIGHHFVRDFVRNFPGIPPSLSAFTENECVPTELHLATGQHYGLRTAFLDFSLDPSVAIWFACDTRNTGDQVEACVFALPSLLAAQIGARILLPHPYVRRLYRQRGVFVDMDSLSHRDVKWLSIEVRFPTNSLFEVVRAGRVIDVLGAQPDVLAADADYWWMYQVDVARNIVARGRLERLLALPTGNLEAAQIGLSSLINDYREPPFSTRVLLKQSAADLLDMLFSFATAGPYNRFQ